MATARVSRGRKTEDLVAEWYRLHGWPDAKKVPASEGGTDITGMLYLWPEVKARGGFSPLAWIRQARKNARGGIPFVIMRCNGQGPEQLGEWLVIRPLAEDTFLLEMARDNGALGYWDGDDSE